MVERVERYLNEKIEKDGALHMTLLDPEKIGSDDGAAIAREAESAGTAAVMVGGSTLASNSDLDDVVMRIKASVKVPVILFPNNITGVSRHADAIWFMSLLNSSNTYYLIDVQALTARLVRCYGLEVLPMGYIIVGEGGAAGFIGQARPIPYDHPELALGYSLAAEALGMRFVYLEAGSGAMSPVPTEMIKLVGSHLSVPLIVGGGIRDGAAARKSVEAGAEIIVTGTLVEDTDKVRERIYEVVKNIISVRG
ncbi:geranylgeranylglyceryl phosphate synthase [miscellaneous Crenarchaeota group-15 archaeon DG-45]|uniref:Geranylgeranylglyceryl phosphate synthase n=1 Tax=miscellaneous Crenarchaeota group-15 archaeon DG-45 TaxID=1685127 RepID=A0A0M0BTU5_9ARCH|nr:MAG: geranylgeranylglyceryl phosphate synthase [miscellaneous Crenarchaeota group-15 archaeon DG-45]